MNLQSKLQELKSMHEQGLVTAEVYTEQQKLLLSQGLNSTEVIGSTSLSEILCVRHNMSKRKSMYAKQEETSRTSGPQSGVAAHS